MTWCDFLFTVIACFWILSKNSKWLSCSFECFLSISWSNFWSKDIISVKWGIWGVLVTSYTKNTALRLWFTWNWWKIRCKTFFVIFCWWWFILILIIHWLSSNLMLVIIKWWSLHECWGIWASEQILESLMDIIFWEIIISAEVWSMSRTWTLFTWLSFLSHNRNIRCWCMWCNWAIILTWS